MRMLYAFVTFYLQLSMPKEHICSSNGYLSKFISQVNVPDILKRYNSYLIIRFLISSLPTHIVFGLWSLGYGYGV